MDLAGYRELEHTADWELEIWAPDFSTLLTQAAKGMYSLTDTELNPNDRQTKHIELRAPDQETLLVDFLTELLWLGESEGLAFDTFSISLHDSTLEAELTGAPINRQTKEIKAVTYHNLSIKCTDAGMEVRIVFDV